MPAPVIVKSGKARRGEMRVIRLKISNLLDQHCNGCSEVTHLSTHTNERIEYCNQNCPIGKQLLTLGRQLDQKGGMEKMESAKAANVLREKAILTKEKYLQHKQDGLSDLQIRNQYGFKSPNDLTDWKKKNGLDGYRLGGQSEKQTSFSMNVKPEGQQQVKDEVQPEPVLAEIQEPKEPDNSPSAAREIECIDAIEAVTIGLTGGQAYTAGAVIDALWRWTRKGDMEELQKARWYIDRLIEKSQR